MKAPETPDAFENFLAQGDGGTHAGCRQPRPHAEHRVRQEVVADAGCTQLGPEPRIASTTVEQGSGTDPIPFQRVEDVREIGRVDRHVAIADDDDRMLGQRIEVDEVRNLPARSVKLRGDHRAEVDGGVVALERCHCVRRPIVDTRVATKDLYCSPVVLVYESSKVLLETRLHAAQRFQQRDRFVADTWRPAFPDEEKTKRENRDQAVHNSGNCQRLQCPTNSPKRSTQHPFKHPRHPNPS